MEAPETLYARRDGLHIAYQVWDNGTGGPDLLDLGHGTFISIDEAYEQPQWRRYTERLADCGRIIRLDPAGVGMSDTPASLADLTFHRWVADIEAVLDAVGATRVVLLAVSGSTQPALLFVSEHPERVESMILVNGSARYVEADDYPIGIPRELMEEFWEGLDPDSPVDIKDDLSDLRLFAPSTADDPDFQRWWSRASKRGAAPATATALSAQIRSVDLRSLLPGITAPTLVMHRRQALAPPVEHGRYLAEHIPGARMVELPGDDVVPFIGDLDGLVDEIHQFVTGERYRPGPNRVLATVLFTDIVDSTATAARLGDRQWNQVLVDHQTLVQRQLPRFGGQLIKDTGDGLLATFDGPARAIRCALSIRDGAGHLGLQMRAGLNAGEIERRGDDIAGIAVHVAARVMGEATAAEVLVTATVVDLVEGAGIEFVDRGIHPLRGVPNPRHLWAVASA